MKKILRSPLAHLVLLASGLCGLAMFSIPAPAQDSKEPQAWVKRCTDLKDGKKYCEVFQRLVAKQTNQRVAELAVGYPDGKKAARGVAVLPLGILLNAKDGVQMQIDDQKPFTFQIRFCTGDGCFGYLNFSDAVLALLKKGNEATFLFSDSGGKKVNVKMSLKGFSKALEGIAPPA